MLSDELDVGRYLLGNATAALITEKFDFEFGNTETLNAVQTCAMKRFETVRKDFAALEDLGKKEFEHEIVVTEGQNEGEQLIELPKLDENAAELSLLKITGADFKKAQQAQPYRAGLHRPRPAVDLLAARLTIF